jgi:creatinine amidohydrolase
MRAVPTAVRETIAARAARVPAEVARHLEEPIDVGAFPAGAALVVTGVGASEGPARYLVALAALAGVRATFAPLSAFLGPVPARLGDTLVVFSQGLSPNARLAIAQAGTFRRALLVTSVAEARASAEVAAPLARFRGAGGEVLVLPPEDEPGTLTRVLGPAVALVAAARLGARLGAAVDEAALRAAPGALASAPRRAREAIAGAPPGALHRRIALVTIGASADAAHGLVGKWLEGLGAPPPALWDVLAVAHGPFHQLFDEEATLVALTHEGDARERDALDRLESMLRPGRHALVRLASALPAPLGAIDHDAQWTALLLAALDERSKDLGGACGHDAPLYALGRDA